MEKIKKRKPQVVVISDVHLGTYGCQAKELLKYLKTIKPQILILNGDIIDIWQFKKRYWPKDHMMVVKQVMHMMAKGVKLIYIPGNHDEMMRKFVGFKLGNLKIVNKYLLEVDGKTAWVFHGDVFDVTMQYSKWLTKLGSVGYDLLILLNSFINYISMKLGRGKVSLSKKIKDSVKGAVKFINRFEETCADIAIEKGYEYIVCGHIHKPEIKQMENTMGSVEYLNSGDWVENLTSLEYYNGKWHLYKYHQDETAKNLKLKQKNKAEKSYQQLFQDLMIELSVHKAS